MPKDNECDEMNEFMKKDWKKSEKKLKSNKDMDFLYREYSLLYKDCFKDHYYHKDAQIEVIRKTSIFTVSGIRYTYVSWYCYELSNGCSRLGYWIAEGMKRKFANKVQKEKR